MIPYYADDAVTIHHGDCLDVMRQMPDGSVDMVFTSPPYNLGTTTGGGFARSEAKAGKWSGGSLAGGYGTHSDALSPDEYVAWQHAILTECWRMLCPAGAIFYNHKPRVQAGVLHTPLDLNPGLPVRQIIIWARAGGLNFAPTHYVPTHEWIVVLAKPDFRLKSKEASGVGDVWRVTQETGNPHPAPFPVGLPARAIESVAPSVVLDPFMGSGTTLRAAKDAGVRSIGIELEEKWCRHAADRLAQESLFGAVDNGAA